MQNIRIVKQWELIFQDYLIFLLGKKDMRILIVGLDSTGKIPIFYLLKIGKVLTTIPTTGFEFILFTIYFIFIFICIYTFTCLFYESNFYILDFLTYSRSLTISHNNNHFIFKYYQEKKTI